MVSLDRWHSSSCRTWPYMIAQVRSYRQPNRYVHVNVKQQYEPRDSSHRILNICRNMRAAVTHVEASVSRIIHITRQEIQVQTFRFSSWPDHNEVHKYTQRFAFIHVGFVAGTTTTVPRCTYNVHTSIYLIHRVRSCCTSPRMRACTIADASALAGVATTFVNGAAHTSYFPSRR